jgi:hypothetical protein
MLAPSSPVTVLNARRTHGVDNDAPPPDEEAVDIVSIDALRPTEAEDGDA